MKKKNGYTVVELMVVASIATIVLKMAGTTFSASIDKAEMEIQFKKVEGVLNKARSLARNNLNCLDLNVSANELELQPYADCSMGSPLPPTSFTFPAGLSLSIEGGGSTIAFNEYGGLMGSSPEVLKVNSTTGHVQKFKILPLLGLVQK